MLNPFNCCTSLERIRITTINDIDEGNKTQKFKLDINGTKYHVKLVGEGALSQVLAKAETKGPFGSRYALDEDVSSQLTAQWQAHQQARQGIRLSNRHELPAPPNTPTSATTPLQHTDSLPPSPPNTREERPDLGATPKELPDPGAQFRQPVALPNRENMRTPSLDPTAFSDATIERLAQAPTPRTTGSPDEYFIGLQGQPPSNHSELASMLNIDHQGPFPATSEYLHADALQNHSNRFFNDAFAGYLSKALGGKGDKPMVACVVFPNLIEQYNSVGHQSGQFVTSVSALTKTLITSNGDIGAIERALEIPQDSWKVRADNPDPKAHPHILMLNIEDLELPTGNENGAFRGLWQPGGFTKGAAPEAIINAIPRDKLNELLANGKAVLFEVNPENCQKMEKAWDRYTVDRARARLTHPDPARYQQLWQTPPTSPRP